MDNKKTIELENVIVEATKRLDIDMFKEFLIHVEDFKNSKKSYFANDLEKAFNKFKETGDIFLESEFGYCGKCNKGCTGHLFIGNKSRNYINLIFQIDNENFIDMGECCDFKPYNKIENLNHRIYIHTYNDTKSDEYIPF